MFKWRNAFRIHMTTHNADEPQKCLEEAIQSEMSITVTHDHTYC
jgi:hypothetical protein